MLGFAVVVNIRGPEYKKNANLNPNLKREPVSGTSRMKISFSDFLV
jgi:hypothetical protein